MCVRLSDKMCGDYKRDTKARGKGLNEENTDCAAAVCPLVHRPSVSFPNRIESVGANEWESSGDSSRPGMI